MTDRVGHWADDPRVVDRALGAFLGLAVGDALGATVEFMTAAEIARRHGVHRQMVGGGWLQLRPGQVTDDTELALAMSSAVIAVGGWDPRAIAEAFLEWMRRGPVDIGNTCRRGIVHYLCTRRLSVPPSKADGGNGAAMRHLPAVLVSLGDEGLAAQRGIEQGHLTHHHPKSDAAIVTLARMTHRLIRSGAEAACDDLVVELIREHPDFAFRPWPGRTSGYVVDTVQTVFDGFFNTDNFEECLVRVVNRGGDADTAGALAGQLAGALHGLEGIPRRWLGRLDPGVADAIRRQTPRLLRLA